ncbi:MAG: CoA-binding protein [Thermodesulfobacteriota bacterium]|nr:CoA-binding protein [Thermodesulfobacteriota bacterium]
MDFFFNPRGIAVIGATTNPNKGGYHILDNCLHGYKGPVFPVNPAYETVLGQKCYPDIASIPGVFDLVIYFIPAENLPETIEACAKKGVKGIIIESAGFAEVGAKGKTLQQQCLELAHTHGIRLWGPNCMGLIDAHSRHMFSFMYDDTWKTLLTPGPVSMIVQSGMLSAGFLLMILDRGGMGIRRICSIGNKCDVDETELLEYLLDDPETHVIGMYIESIRDARKFMDLVQRASKPIVLLKGGKSPGGMRAAQSHTASMAGNHEIMQYAFRQMGICQVSDVNELTDFLRGFSKTHGFSARQGTGVISFSGAGGIITADLLQQHGLNLANPSSKTLGRLKEIFPEWMPPAHPLDIWPAIEKNGLKKVYTHAIDALMHDDGVDSLVIHMLANRTNPELFEGLAQMKDELKKPVIVWLTGTGTGLYNFRMKIEKMGIPVFEEMDRGIAFLAAAQRYFIYRASRA